VAITPASGFVAPWAAIVIGLLAGTLCYGATRLRARLRIADTLDVWACHGIGGAIGIVCTGIFADPLVNGKAGLIHGGTALFGVQFFAAAVGAAFAFGATFALLKGIDRIWAVAVPDSHHGPGLDAKEHGEVAYSG
jgi:Amt family ammonium transporter